MIVVLFLAFIICVFFLYRDPKGQDSIYTFKTEFTPSDDTLKVMSYNIGFGAGLEGLKGVTYSKSFIENNLNKITQIINQESPDILCVQEIDISSKRSYKIDQVKFIAEQCGYPYIAIAHTWNRYYIPFPFSIDFRKHFGKILAGQAIFSKYPIQNQIVITLPPVRSKPWWYRFFYLHHVMQTVTISYKNTSLEIVNLHFEAFDNQSRQNQADYAISEIEDVFSTLPVIIAGDFNAVESQASELFFQDEPHINYGNDGTIEYFKRTAFLKNATELKDGTFPSHAPNRQLDYIFYNKNCFNTIKSKKISEAKLASDHLPVYAEFKLNVSQDSL